MGRLAQTIYGIPPAESGGGKCKVGDLLDSLPPEDAEDLRTALTTKIGKNYAASASRIALALSQIDNPVGQTLIREHRTHTCACYRKVVPSE